MFTSDDKITAIATAKECGIINEGEENEECVCMEGPEFAEYVGGLDVPRFIEKMKYVNKKLKILSHSRPNDKYKMVAGLK
jgi:magnesium-transporting ATPase (P-type)